MKTTLRTINSKIEIAENDFSEVCFETDKKEYIHISIREDSLGKRLYIYKVNHGKGVTIFYRNIQDR